MPAMLTLKRCFAAALLCAAFLSPSAMAKVACDVPNAFQVNDEADLIQGPKALGRVGDFKLCNSKVSFIIEGARHSSSYSPYGGSVVDAAFTGEPENDLFDKVFLMFQGHGASLTNIRNARATEVSVQVTDGRAVVRVQADDAEMPILDSYFGRKSPSMGILATIEYVLEKDGAELLTRITLRKKDGGSGRVGLGMGFFAGDDLNLVTPRYGYRTHATTNKKLDWLAATTEDMSFLWAMPKRSFVPLFAYNTSIFGGYKYVKIPKGGSATEEFHMVVGRGDLESIRLRGEEIRHPGDPLPQESIRVSVSPDRDGQRCSYVPVYLLWEEQKDDWEFVSMARTDGECMTSFTVVPGTYRVLAGEEGVGTYGDITTKVTRGRGSSVLLHRPATGTLAVTLKDEDTGRVLPTIVRLLPRFDVPDLPGEVGRGLRRSGEVWLQPQGVTPNVLEVREGTYRLFLSYGWEYTYLSKDVTIRAGDVQALTETLKRQVDRTGWVSVDPHMHFLPSNDSDHSLEEGVLAAAAMDLDVAVATDHNMVTDLAPTLAKVDVDGMMKSVIGIEMTTYSTGHFNVFPIQYDRNLPYFGFDVPDWHHRTVPQLFDTMRQQHGEDIIIQINHARGGAKGGYFDSVGYDRLTGKPKDAALMPPDIRFQAMELLNSPHRDRFVPLKADWYSFLKQGKRVVGTGVSDVHNYWDLDTGYCRTYVYTGKPTIHDVPVEEVIDQFRKGAAVASCGHFLTVTANGKGGPGDLVHAPGGKVTLEVRVQASDWVSAEKLWVDVNGDNVKELPLPHGDGPMDERITVELFLDKDSFVTVWVTGEGDMKPVFRYGLPTTIANPIYFDTGGDGAFQAPGLTPPAPAPPP